ncbi:MAG: peptide chain release factor N(5)-glutamine methyltransferase [Clostridiales bacterium]|jgi:release factor glutamine methyltransferase|nr:peptide chain release factor N(5)-glutamine methyltransferase [Clostridiales bacterium]
MTLAQVYQNGKEYLRKAGVESPAFDAMCLFEAVFGYNRQGLLLHGDEPAPNDRIVVFNDSIHQRADKRPLQYIVGEWPFLSLTLKIGEGVLIPREDTELLVRTAEEMLRLREKAVALDLCAGTGAVGLGLASLLPQVEVTCVEFFDEALTYLKENLQRHPELASVNWMQADVLDPAVPEQFGMVDAIVSNPPYVITGEMETLQEEVRREPSTALDGGEDGLRFYRALAENWVPILKKGGIFAVEIGEGQAEAVRELFTQAGLKNIRIAKDFGGIDRVVAGMKL